MSEVINANNSILTSIKKILGIPEEHEHFDADIIMHINTVFMILNQLGVGPASGFKILDKTTMWDDYLKNDSQLEAVKSYMGYKVRLMFDPPSSSAITESINHVVSELEWRILVMVESKNSREEES